MKFKASAISVALLTAFGAVGTAQAVVLSEDGAGQVLIYPYFTVQGGTDTAISVVNSTGFAKAVKVRFLEGKDSKEVLDFNLYLSKFDVWSGAVSRDASGNAILRTTDKSCTAPQVTGDVPFRNYAFTGSNSDKAGAGLDRAREGYVEIIEMGVVNNTFDLTPSNTSDSVTFGPSVTHVAGAPSNCAAVNAAWSNGVFEAAVDELSAPTGGLIGSANIINVGEGTDYSYDPVVLDAFTTNANHTNPGNQSPNLGFAFPPVSNVFQPATNTVVTDVWTTGTDAVSAVLMRQALLNEYTVETSLNAATDWVVTFPTKGLLVQLESLAPLATLKPFLSEFDDTQPAGRDVSTYSTSADVDSNTTPLAEGDSKGACEQMSPTVYGREEEIKGPSDLDFSPPPPSGPAFQLCWEVNVVAMKNASVLQSANLLSTLSGFDPQNGWIEFAFPSQYNLVAPSGTTYAGLPAVGFAVEKYVNGNLGGVLSNYGGAFIHKYRRSIIPAP